jgi:hypothetical protein
VKTGLENASYFQGRGFNPRPREGVNCLYRHAHQFLDIKFASIHIAILSITAI